MEIRKVTKNKHYQNLGVVAQYSQMTLFVWVEMVQLCGSVVEIVPHIFFGSWNRSQKVFGEVELVPKKFWELELVPSIFLRIGTYSTLFFTLGPFPHLQNFWWNRSQNVGLSPPSAKKNLGPIPTSIFEWDLFHLEAVGLIPWDLVDFTELVTLL